MLKIQKGKSLAGFTKREKTQINKIRNESEDVTADTTEIRYHKTAMNSYIRQPKEMKIFRKYNFLRLNLEDRKFGWTYY